MRADYEIRDRVAAYLLDELGLEELQRIVIGRAWIAAQEPAASEGAAAGEFLAEIELRFAEYTSGHLEEAELRDHLRDILRTYRLDLPPRSGSSARTATAALPFITPLAFSSSEAAGRRS